MKFTALRHKKTPEFASIETFDDGKTFHLYTHDLPDPRPADLTIEQLKAYYDQHHPIPEKDVNFDDLEIRQYECFEVSPETLEFYVVRSKDGKYLRTKGYSGYGESWVTDLKKAKVYTKKGPASAQVTWWANNYPQYGVPDLVPIKGIIGDPIDQELRVVRSQLKKEIAKTKRELTEAQERVKRAQKVLNDIKSGGVENKLKAEEARLREIENKLIELTKD